MTGWTLALDVDGVLLDSDRAGRGHWTVELEQRLGLRRADLDAAFFVPFWKDVLTGRRPIEPALGEALSAMGATATVDEVLECWFEADFVAFPRAVELASDAAACGVRVILATNQEHRRAQFLRERFSSQFPIAHVVYSAAVGAQKHRSAFFEAASASLSVRHEDRQRILFVDDQARNVSVAQAAGWGGTVADAQGEWIDVVRTHPMMQPRA